jgi:D-alanine-D-alanine ligase
MKQKCVMIFYDRINETSAADEISVLDEVEVISGALRRAGYAPVPVPFSLDIGKAIQAIQENRPQFIFNLVESVEGYGQLIYLAPAIFDYMKVPYTGCKTEAFFVTSNQVVTKQMLRLSQIPTPKWLSLSQGESPDFSAEDESFIVKPLWDDGSVGIDESSVVSVKDRKELLDRVKRARARTGKEYFAEAYIDGREFNVSILAGEVLPVAEIRFANYPEDKKRIVDYKSKWIHDSFEYNNTPRRFKFKKEEEPLIDELRSIASRCWNLFQLRAYARVDFRVDGNLRPWVLEVNVNPSLSKDGGFLASARKSGLTVNQTVMRIIESSSVLKPEDEE